MAPKTTYVTHMLRRTRDELLKEPPQAEIERKSKCYTTYIQVGGILMKALVDPGAEITCISK